MPTAAGGTFIINPTVKTICIGILAWNEEPSILITLEGLFQQSLLRCPEGRRVEVRVVPNGCTDRTAAVARHGLEALVADAPPGVSGEVIELEQPGKTNAWNRFIHDFSPPETDYFILADADIQFHGEDTLLHMVRVLESDDHVKVATDTPIKHIALKDKPTWRERISLGISAMTRAAPGQLTGQLYAARAVELRRIVMPAGLIVEDGFLKNFICTDGFQAPVDDSVIRRAPDAAHVFEAYLSLKDVLPNQRRQAIGHTLYTYLRDTIKARVAAGELAESFLKRKQEDDPDWFVQIIRERVAGGGPWVMHSGALSVRWKRLARMKGWRKPAFFPAALAGWLLDLVVYAWANHTLKKGRLKGIWKDTRNTAIRK